MPKYLLLKHYRGGPDAAPARYPRWTSGRRRTWRRTWPSSARQRAAPGERRVGRRAGADPGPTWVRYGGPDAAPVITDGPLPETSDLAAGWYMIDVESYERAVELAAYVSSEPGPGGTPMYEWIDVREVMSEIPRTTDGRARRTGRTAGRGRAARPRPAGARGPGPPGRGLRRRRGRAAGGAPRGAAGVAGAPAARPACLVDDRRDPTARRRPPQRGRPWSSRGGGATPSPGRGPARRATTRSSCSSAAATPTSPPRPRWR